jgi:DNA-binding XRE family transcriptional regulator
MKSIRALRQERGWTQFELALKVGVQPQAVYFWESGRRTPQVAQMRKLGEIFGMCSDDIDVELASVSTSSHRQFGNQTSEVVSKDGGAVTRSGSARRDS